MDLLWGLNFRLIRGFNTRNNIKLSKKQDSDFILRLWIVTRAKYIEYFEINRSINGRCYVNKVGNVSKESVVEVDIEYRYWNLFWDSINRDAIMSIPDESTLKWDLYRKVNGEYRRTLILHAHFYYIQVFSNGKFNKFAYRDPWAHSWPEAKRAVNIIMAINRLCKSAGIVIKY